MKVAYVRVSTLEQNEARQMEALIEHEIEKFFVEKVSGIKQPGDLNCHPVVTRIGAT